MSSVRRVYFYLVTLITLGIFAGGIGVLLSLLFDITISGSTQIGQANFLQQQLSLGLAMLVIGGPLWFFFWRSIQKQVNGNPSEIGATLRKFFMNFILVVSSLTAIFAAQTVITWLLSGAAQSQNSSGSLATFIVTLAVWYYYWRVSESEGHPSASAKTLRRWYVYIVSGWGLVLLTVGLVQLIDSSVRFLPLWGNSLVNGTFWNTPVQENIGAIIMGGLLWAFHWFRMSKNDVNSTLRQVYIYLLAIIVSSIAGLVALTMGIYQILGWALGGAGEISSTYFQFIGWVVPTLVVTAAIWIYHQSVAQEEAAQLPERLLSSKRVHLYIMSFIGLGTLISGLIILFGTILDLIINSINPAIAFETGWWQHQLSLSLALLIVAVPLWMYYWNQIIKLSSLGGVVEWKPRSRRIYLYVIIGASIIALAADLVNIVYQFLSGLLTGSFGVSVLQNSKWSIQSLIVAIPLLIYHWQIARKDQRRGAEAAAVHKMVTALTDNQSAELIQRLESKLGARIHILEYTVAPAPSQIFSDEELTKVISEIETSSAQKVMLLIHEGKIRVLPYQEK
jgi:hypothetical protein